MVRLDAILDSANDETAQTFVNADTRNHIAFLELSHYEKNKTFLYKHPLLIEYKLEKELEQLRKLDPEKFMRDLINADKSITRYRSQISNKKYKNDDERADWMHIIEEYSSKLSLMKQLISK